MRIAQPKPFFFEHGKRAVLLLHGFTGTSADVRMLGRFLEKHNYTSLAPHYRGHGVPPEELIKTNPEQWWEDVLSAYNKLKEAGYEEIAVAGLSLGGVFSLKLASEFPLTGIVTMCAPMTMKTTDLMWQGVLKYARDYKKFAGMPKEQITEEMNELKTKSMPGLDGLQSMVQGVRKEVSHIYTPLLVVQSRHDEVIDPQSAQIIYDEAESTYKELQWYEESGHVITLGPEKAQLHENVLKFLESLDWQE
ncbi:carboxylesterase [Sporosarcina sp. P37]|uniref:alpha/beta hydrolase n=1 Tax=unclassified Sporosarcina TaxID=2647733 RepID=UPI000A17D838|nr:MULTISPECIES: carboxylesterase [unclassified Sporosarcina]ARK24131.1 carboxylesterase [Sporosarcina sp. P37]PID17373.1 carboxylesterase [Sporosarcina sp. P35]